MFLVLCDANGEVIFFKKDVQEIKVKKLTINGVKNPKTNFWLLPLNNNNDNNNNVNNNLDSPTLTQTTMELQHPANSAYHQKLASHLQAFHHASQGAL